MLLAGSLPAAAETPVVVDLGYARAIVADREAAAIATRELAAAREAARRWLGIDMAGGAVLDVAVPATTSGLDLSGAAWTLPWIFQREADRPGAARANASLRHEIGHAVFIQFLIPRSPGARYGGDAPDWLDEAAAILFEDPTTTAERRTQFRLLRAHTAMQLPLGRFLEMEHPTLALAPGNIGASSAVTAADGSAIATFTVTGASDLPAFYTLARVFLDYLLERSGDGRILRTIALGLDGGRRSFADWLAREGPRHGLSDTLASLERDFNAWVAAHYGEAPTGNTESP